MSDLPAQGKSPALTGLLGVVAIGGALGALARYAVSVLLPVESGQFPIATLVVNLSGCLALGVLLPRWRDSPRVIAFLGTGVLGGFTTFSTFAVETDHLLRVAPVTALIYIALSVLGGCAAAAVGLRVR